MLTLKDFDYIIKVVEDVYENRPVVVAGGAVRDYLLGLEPKDIDVFVLGCQNVPQKKSGWATLPGNFIHRQPESAEEYRYERWGEASIPISHVDNYDVVGFDRTRRLQIIFTSIDEGGKLLGDFDWNICQFGYHHSSGVVSITPIDEIEQLETVNPNLRSVARGERFSERYGLRISKRSLKVLRKFEPKILVKEALPF